MRLGIIVESSSSCHVYLGISNGQQFIACCVVNKCFNTVIESCFTIYGFLAPRITDVTILYSCKVLKTFNCHLSHKNKFTIITENALCNHFDSIYGSSTLFIIYTLDFIN